MKKALTFVVLIVTPSMMFGQGTVVIANQTGLVKQWTSTSDSTLIRVPTNGGYVELIAAAKGTALPSVLWTGTATSPGGFNYSSLSVFLAANPGWAVAFGPYNPGPIGVGTPPLAPGVFANGNATIANIGAGASADYILLGWTGPSTSVDAATAATRAGQAMFGESAIASTTTGDPTLSGGAGLPINLKETFAGMTLAPPVIPEPTTVLPASLGAVLLLLFRRRGLGSGAVVAGQKRERTRL